MVGNVDYRYCVGYRSMELKLYYCERGSGFLLLSAFFGIGDRLVYHGFIHSSFLEHYVLEVFVKYVSPFNIFVFH